MARTVHGPDGASWRVGRVWVTRRARWRGKHLDLDVLDATELLGFVDDGIFAGIALAIMVIAVLVLAVLFLFPLLILVLELALVVLVVAGGLGARVLLRKPWIVALRKGRAVERTWKRSGWRASGRLVDEIALAVERGQPLPF